MKKIIDNQIFSSSGRDELSKMLNGFIRIMQERGLQVEIQYQPVFSKSVNSIMHNAMAISYEEV